MRTIFLLAIGALILQLSPNAMHAQKKNSIDQPFLHGHYRPHGHFGRTYTFYNHGRFESHEKGNELKGEVLGKGKFKLEGKKLELTFETMPLPGEMNAAVEKAHTEHFKVKLETDNSFEVTRFRINLKGPRRSDPTWVRTDEFLPYQEATGNSNQE